MELVFETELKADPETVWSWVSSGAGINKELSPILRMSSIAMLKTRDFEDAELGKPFRRCWFLLFRFIPMDIAKLTLLQLEPGSRILEQSPMLSMKLWRHERTVIPRNSGSVVRDRLNFEPRFLRRLSCWFVDSLFKNRHKVLKKQFG